MAERDYVHVLRQARGKLVETRRNLAERIANPSAGNPAQAPNFVSVQDAIDAVDRALVDEESAVRTAAPAG